MCPQQMLELEGVGEVFAEFISRGLAGGKVRITFVYLDLSAIEILASGDHDRIVGRNDHPRNNWDE